MDQTLPAPERSAYWRNADNVSADAARYLDLLANVIAEAKRRSIDLLRLRAGLSVLEVGCGVGHDALRLAAQVGPAGRVVGIDLSAELITRASQRAAPLGLPVRFEVGNAQALGFADDSFDAARVDRVLQHLDDPGQAVREMARVVRPGGRVVALEPDWETMVVAGPDPAIARAVTQHKANVSLAHGTVGRDLRRLLVEAGCREVTVEQGAMSFDSLLLADDVLSLRRNLDAVRERGEVSAEAAAAWWRALEQQDRAGTFYAAMCGVIAGGTVG
jgi:ubiquinone/menaquinone biosynthesis C-methylase UbiE